jgi:hypothetical protein
VSPNSESDNTKSFFTKLVNNTNVNFTKAEVNLLEKGLKYCPNLKTNHQDIENLSIDLDIALDNNNREKYVLSTFLNKQSFINHRKNTDNSVIKTIKEKIIENKLVITKADKGNCTILLHEKDYVDKVNDILNTGDFEILNKDPTPKFVDEVRDILKNSKTLFGKNAYYFYKQNNPQPPRLYGLPKVHKQNTPVRPVVSYISAPCYKLARSAIQIFNKMGNFKPLFTIKNTLELIEKIKNTSVPNNAKLISFDVVSLFTSVPIDELKLAFDDHLDSLVLNPVQKNELKHLIFTCLDQNYFKFQQQIYRQKQGLAMGSPLSPLMADFFMNHLEKTITKLPLFKNLLFYFRYVDDILGLWVGTERQLDQFLTEINNINKSIKFTMEFGDKTINFLDININILNNKLDFDIYRKETYTDNLIHNTSKHHPSQKLSVFHSLLHRLLNVPLSTDKYKKEISTIKLLAKNNGFSAEIIDRLLKNKIRKRESRILAPGLCHTNKNEFIWNKMGFVNEKISNKISQTLKKAKINPAFYNNKSLGKMLINTKDKVDVMEKNGVYKLDCGSCSASYVGKTKRALNIRLKEHTAAINNNHPEKSNFAKHIIENKHIFNNKTISLIHPNAVGKKLDKLEILEINRLKNNEQITIINEQKDFAYSPLLNPYKKNKDPTT